MPCMPEFSGPGRVLLQRRQSNEIALEDFDSRLEKLKKSIEGDNGKIGDNFRLIELNNDFYDPMDDAGINLNINDNANYQLNDNYYM